jgi:hypothetical protein
VDQIAQNAFIGPIGHGPLKGLRGAATHPT